MNENAVTQTQLLDKYHNQIVSRLGQGGLGTDQARAILDSAYPGKAMNIQAIQEAAGNLKGAQAMIQAKTNLLLDPATNRDTTSYQKMEIQFDQAADPRIWQLQALPPDQQKAFVQSLSPQQAADFMKRRAALKQMGAL